MTAEKDQYDYKAKVQPAAATAPMAYVKTTKPAAPAAPTKGIDISSELEKYADELLNERGSTHGEYENTARIIQRLKRVLHDELALREARGQSPLTFMQQESLEMIFHKAGRIISGESGFADHWEDIAGYAKLCLPKDEKK